ncbi:MAG: hypothetical protein ACFFDO_05735 [Candidatus Thorarchaeota archaeon]
MFSRSGHFERDKSPIKKKFQNNNLKVSFEDNSISKVSNAIVSFLSLYKKLLRPDISSETEDIDIEEAKPELKKILNEFNTGDFKVSYEDNAVVDVLNAIVSFLSLSKNENSPDIYSGTEDIPFEKKDPEFKKIMEEEFADSKDKLEVVDKSIETKDQKDFISPKEFVKETAPKQWINANIQSSLSSWLKNLVNKYGIIFDFIVGIMHDFENKQVVLNIDGNIYDITETLNKWEEEIGDYREDDYWYEIKGADYVEWFEVKCEEKLKSKDEIIFDALNKNSNPHFREFMWLAYKTSEKFIMFREKYGRNYQIFLKIGDLITSFNM